MKKILPDNIQEQYVCVWRKLTRFLLMSFIIQLLFLPAPSFAEEKPQHWFFRLGIGSVMGAQSDFILEGNGSVINEQKKVRADNSTAVHFESAYLPPGSFFGFSLLTELNPYAYSTGGSDSQVGIYAVPKLRIPLGFFELWGGVAMGAMLTKIAADSAVMSGYLFTFSESQNVNFALQPRAGFDFNFGSSFKLGFFLAYCKATANASGTATEISSGTSIP